jgi:hypothetical protein
MHAFLPTRSMKPRSSTSRAIARLALIRCATCASGLAAARLKKRVLVALVIWPASERVKMCNSIASEEGGTSIGMEPPRFLKACAPDVNGTPSLTTRYDTRQSGRGIGLCELPTVDRDVRVIDLILVLSAGCHALAASSTNGHVEHHGSKWLTGSQRNWTTSTRP